MGGFSESAPITVRAELAVAGKTIRMHSDEIWSELVRLRADIETILEHWQGGASGYFTQLKGEWDFAANGLFNDVLGQIAVAMDMNWRNYQDTEFANMRTWSRGAPAQLKG